ncbi:gamma-parvin isoform X2 [Salarias fasciatus]|uniref:Calponin-homology (CH) domain-containing protein n=2 Tax=Salarias fasciatus TaxID=181472 RepID=A0A672H6H5_SALFA|nr:gamma-parvin isoform X2 [Salarias fasciatus]XP_029952288.1 gamma-parvin isoform X2 [Salarias fasciatus]
MEADIFKYHKAEDALDAESFQGEKRKVIQPASLKDPRLEKLKEALVDWINRSLIAEHIVVQSLEEDLYDGLVLHHLLSRLGDVNLSVEEIALTSTAQIHKLEVVLDELDKRLGLQDGGGIKWNVKLIHGKDLLATLHLLVAMVRCFQPELDLPSNVKVEVVVVEVSKSGIKSDVQIEVLTEESEADSDSLGRTEREDPIERLLKLDAHKVNTVKKAILHFVNQNMAAVGPQVADMDKQFADGVILLLLIGQLEGFFIPLFDFNLTPVSHSEMLHNVTLALDLLNDCGLQIPNVEPEDIVSQDITATMKVLYPLFKKHKAK